MLRYTLLRKALSTNGVATAFSRIIGDAQDSSVTRGQVDVYQKLITTAVISLWRIATNTPSTSFQNI
jgi:hypothetical protein